MKFKNMPNFVSDILGHFGGETDIFCRILLDYFCLNMVQKQPAPYYMASAGCFLRIIPLFRQPVL